MNSHRSQRRWRKFEDKVTTINTSGIGTQVCAQFGCGVHLTMQQVMFGKYCVSHQVRPVVDPTNVIKFK